MSTSKASQTFNSISKYIIGKCQEDEKMMNDIISSYHLSKHDAAMLRIFITNGYDTKSNEVLAIRRDKVQQNSDENSDQNTSRTNQTSTDTASIHWHYKLKQLSCVKTFINNPSDISKCISNRIVICKMLNDMQLDSICLERITEIVVSLGSLSDEYDKISAKKELKWVRNLKAMNIKEEIQTHQGRKNKGKAKGGDITSFIDKLAFRFVGWSLHVNRLRADIEKQVEFANNAIIKLELGRYDKQNKRFYATLTIRVYCIKSCGIKSILQGAKLFDFIMDMKRKFKTLHQEYEELDKAIKSMRNEDIYTSYLTKISEDKRYKRHKKSNKTKYENRKAKEEDKESKEEEKASEEEKKRGGKTPKASKQPKKNQPQLFEYFRKRKRESSDDGNKTKKRKCDLDAMIVNEGNQKKKSSDKMEMDADGISDSNSNSDEDIDILSYETNQKK
eukprot:1133121_1